MKLSDNELIEKNVPDKKFIGLIKKLEIVLCVSHLYERKPTTEPMDEKKTITKQSNEIIRNINLLFNNISSIYTVVCFNN